MWMVNCLQMAALLVIVFCFFQSHGAIVARHEPAVNERPIIGILSQEQAYNLKDVYAKENFTSYIAASYVKDVEASGARVVPLLIGKDREYYRDILQKINGVLLPGGATYFNQSNGYADAGQHIYELAMEMNDAGDHFPVFGTCLGFELLIILASGRGEPENRIKCQAFSNAAIEFTTDFRSSKMFKSIDNGNVDMLENEKNTVNAHQFCIVDEILVVGCMLANFQNVSSVYPLNTFSRYLFMQSAYPFYGVQFHPEKSSFEWKASHRYAHSPNAIKCNRYFMDFFVGECRKNFHSFESEIEENTYLIYNYKPYFTGKHGSAYSQCFFFEPRGIESD